MDAHAGSHTGSAPDALAAAADIPNCVYVLGFFFGKKNVKLFKKNPEAFSHHPLPQHPPTSRIASAMNFSTIHKKIIEQAHGEMIQHVKKHVNTFLESPATFDIREFVKHVEKKVRKNVTPHLLGAFHAQLKHHLPTTMHTLVPPMNMLPLSVPKKSIILRENKTLSVPEIRGTSSTLSKIIERPSRHQNDDPAAGPDAKNVEWIQHAKVEGSEFMAFGGGLASILNKAYTEHYGLRLRPDDFWAAIAVQLSFYVNAREAELRDRLVNHEGKKELKVLLACGDIKTCPYDTFVEKMTPLIGQNLKTDLAEWYIPSFSTTTSTDKIALGVALMSTVQAYFEYTVNFLCGLPYVELLGTVEDWEALRKKVQNMHALETKDGTMKQWIDLLEPICDELIKTAKGENNITWWQSVSKKRPYGSGRDRAITGWSIAFSAFSSKGVFLPRREPSMGMSPVSSGDGSSEAPTPLSISEFSPGVVSVPVKIIDLSGDAHQSRMFSGCMAARVTRNGNSHPTLEPVTAWSMALENKSETQ